MSNQPEGYNVGWICAIETERVAACELLDEEYTGDKAPYIDSRRDHNIYTFGRIHEHRVVIAGLPQGRYGTSSATRVAEHMQSSFSALRVFLMVGIAGGAPSQKNDIRLGDVVVSCPSRRHCGVINYDFGIAVQQQEFQETGHLAPPSNILLNAVGVLKARHKREGHNISSTVTGMVQRNRRLRAAYSRPGVRMDRLYKADYIHSDQQVCNCQLLLESPDTVNANPNLIHRSQRGLNEDDPAIHHGLIASSDRLIKDAKLRDALAEKHDVLCFEMEAAGLMNSDLRCLVIRGICDYADTHKNDMFQGYAAATAAAYAKELLQLIPGSCSPLPAFGVQNLSTSQIANHFSSDTQEPANTNVEIGTVDLQQSSIQPVQDGININIFLAGMRKIFTESSKASRDTRIDICVEIAKHSDQLKASVRVQQASSLGEQQEEQETDEDQVFLNCISRCKKRKPSEAAEVLSRSFSGSADFSFERSSNYYPEQYSVIQTLQERTFFIASKEAYNETGYSMELFLYYLVKRRRWQRVHMCVTAAEKIGDLAMIPISATDKYEYFVVSLPQSFVQMLESVLQDLDLTDYVTRVRLPLCSSAGGTFQYNFDNVLAEVDYEQKQLLGTIEGDTIKCLRDMGCKQYQESQLTTLERAGRNSFLVTDGSHNYIEYKAPFARTAWTINEFERFIEDMIQAKKLSNCQGVNTFVGIVLDDHGNHIRGYLLQSAFSGLRRAFSIAELKGYTFPQALRRFWAKQLVTSASEIHSRGMAIGNDTTISISNSLDLMQTKYQGVSGYLRMSTNYQTSEVRTGNNSVSECTRSMQKKDILQLGLDLWYLSEHLAFGNRYLCTLFGCTTRPRYRCLDKTHRNPISLPFSQRGDPILRAVIEQCRMEDPKKRPSAQELVDMISNRLGPEDNEIEVSRHKKAFRMAMKDVTEYPLVFMYCDECMIPLSSHRFNCNICFGGDFDLCGSCVASGVHCLDDDHRLRKMRMDSSENPTQGPHRLS